MASESDIRNASRLLGNLPEQAETCASVAAALIETDQAWIRCGLVGVVHPTDYQRARRGLIRDCRLVRQCMAEIRRDTLSGELIRAEVMVERILVCCRECPTTNLDRQRHGRPFGCLIQERIDQGRAARVRFRLNAKGQILEQA